MAAATEADWEIIAASVILVGVLATIDAGLLGQPSLLLSLAPLVFVMAAAFVRLTQALVLAWVGAFVLLAIFTGEHAIAGLSYPALVMVVLLAARRYWGTRS